MPRRRRRRRHRRRNSTLEPQNLEMEHAINRSRSVTAARERYGMSGREIVFIQRPLKVFYNTRRWGRHAPAQQTHSRFRVRYVARGRCDPASHDCKIPFWSSCTSFNLSSLPNITAMEWKMWSPTSAREVFIDAFCWFWVLVFGFWDVLFYFHIRSLLFFFHYC